MASGAVTKWGCAHVTFDQLEKELQQCLTSGISFKSTADLLGEHYR
jgi:hypothetical protein